MSALPFIIDTLSQISKIPSFAYDPSNTIFVKLKNHYFKKLPDSVEEKKVTAPFRKSGKSRKVTAVPGP